MSTVYTVYCTEEVEKNTCKLLYGDFDEIECSIIESISEVREINRELLKGKVPDKYLKRAWETEIEVFLYNYKDTFPPKVLSKMYKEAFDSGRLSVIYKHYRIDAPTAQVIVYVNRNKTGEYIVRNVSKRLTMTSVGQAKVWLSPLTGDAVLWEIIFGRGFHSFENFTRVHEVLEIILSDLNVKKIYTLNYDPAYEQKAYKDTLRNLGYRNFEKNWMVKKVSLPRF